MNGKSFVLAPMLPEQVAKDEANRLKALAQSAPQKAPKDTTRPFKQKGPIFMLRHREEYGHSDMVISDLKRPRLSRFHIKPSEEIPEEPPCITLGITPATAQNFSSNLGGNDFKKLEEPMIDLRSNLQGPREDDVPWSQAHHSSKPTPPNSTHFSNLVVNFAGIMELEEEWPKLENRPVGLGQDLSATFGHTGSATLDHLRSATPGHLSTTLGHTRSAMPGHLSATLGHHGSVMLGNPPDPGAPLHSAMFGHRPPTLEQLHTAMLALRRAITRGAHHGQQRLPDHPITELNSDHHGIRRQPPDPDATFRPAIPEAHCAAAFGSFHPAVFGQFRDPPPKLPDIIKADHPPDQGTQCRSLCIPEESTGSSPDPGVFLERLLDPDATTGPLLGPPSDHDSATSYISAVDLAGTL